MLTTAKSSIPVRHVTVGNLAFKLLGVAIAAPFVGFYLQHVRHYVSDATQLVVLYHLAFNVVVSIGFIGLTNRVASLVTRLMPVPVPCRRGVSAVSG